MSTTSTWSPIDGAAAVTFAQFEADQGIALVCDSETAGQFAFQTLAAAEAILRAMRVRPIELSFAPYFAAIVGPFAAGAFGAVAPTTIDPVLGGGEQAIRAFEKDAGKMAAWPASQLRDLTLCYLATQRATRELVRTCKVTTAPASFSVTLAPTPSLPQLPTLPQGDLRFAALGGRLMVTVLGVAALAASAWTVAQVSGQRVELDRDAARMAQQTRIASELAAQAIANGQPVNIPDVVRALGQQEERSLVYGPWVLGALGVGGAFLVGRHALKGRRAT